MVHLLVSNRKMLFFFLASLLLSIPVALPGSTPVFQKTEEERLTGLYLYNFLMFVDWPEEAFTQDNQMRICFFGNPPPCFDSLKSLHGKTVKGVRLAVRQITHIKDMAKGCHVIFVDSSVSSLIPEVLEKLKGTSVLTVSDLDGFAELGGMVELSGILDKEAPPYSGGQFSSKSKRLRINLKAVQSAGLKIRARLLRISDILADD